MSIVLLSHRIVFLEITISQWLTCEQYAVHNDLIHFTEIFAHRSSLTSTTRRTQSLITVIWRRNHFVRSMFTLFVKRTLTTWEDENVPNHWEKYVITISAGLSNGLCVEISQTCYDPLELHCQYLRTNSHPSTWSTSIIFSAASSNFSYMCVVCEMFSFVCRHSDFDSAISFWMTVTVSASYALRQLNCIRIVSQSTSDTSLPSSGISSLPSHLHSTQNPRTCSWIWLAACLTLFLTPPVLLQHLSFMKELLRLLNIIGNQCNLSRSWPPLTLQQSVVRPTVIVPYSPRRVHCCDFLWSDPFLRRDTRERSNDERKIHHLSSSSPNARVRMQPTTVGDCRKMWASVHGHPSTSTDEEIIDWGRGMAVDFTHD